MFSKKAIRIICIILAGLMILTVFIGVVPSLFAADENVMAASPVLANTGDNDGDYIIPAVLIAVAVLAIAVCLILPKLKKKEQPNVNKAKTK